MDKNFVLGVDVGGQTTKCGVVNANGIVVEQTVIRSDTYDTFEPYLAELAQTLKDLIAKAGVEGQVRGIGVGAPNANYYTGDIENAVNLKWGGSQAIHFAKMLEEQMEGIPVTLTNDANAAALGEMTFGAAKGMKDFIMITLGTGVGSGIVINGQMVYGHDGFAGELGHVALVRNNGRLCNCGKTGCLETYCSATGVSRTAREWLDMTNEPSLLRGYDKISAKDVNDCAKQGDELSKRILAYTGTLLGKALADFVTFSAPEAIVLFGGLARNREFMHDSIVASMNDNLLPLWKNKIKIIYTSLKESDAAIIGASALAW